MATIIPEPIDTAAAAVRRPAIDGRYLLYFYLHFTGFLATTLLMTWGMFFLFFLVIGGFSFDGLMHQLNNFASRYVAADADRIAAFKQTITIAHLVLASAIIFFRRHSILPARTPEGSRRHG